MSQTWTWTPSWRAAAEPSNKTGKTNFSAKSLFNKSLVLWLQISLVWSTFLISHPSSTLHVLCLLGFWYLRLWFFATCFSLSSQQQVGVQEGGPSKRWRQTLVLPSSSSSKAMVLLARRRSRFRFLWGSCCCVFAKEQEPPSVRQTQVPMERHDAESTLMFLLIGAMKIGFVCVCWLGFVCFARKQRNKKESFARNSK